MYSIKVVAKKDFFVGPGRHLVIRKGEQFSVDDIQDGEFWVPLRGGGVFGICKFGDDWERV